jgi:hypothetical protein
MSKESRRGGYKREQKKYLLSFEDEDMEGFECLMAGVSLEKFIEITQLSAALETPEGRTPENIEKQFTVIGELIVRWNLEDEDGEPVAADFGGLKKQDFGFVMQIMSGYMQAIASVPKASNSDSSSGGKSEEELMLGLDAPSVSLPS